MRMNELEHLYFVYQPIMHVLPNEEPQVFCYEALLRSRTEKGFPERLFLELIGSDDGNRQLLDRTKQIILPLLKDQAIPLISLNFHHEQFLHTTTWDFLNEMKAYQDKLSIEMTEMPPKLREKSDAQIKGLSEVIIDIHAHGFMISMDDISSGQNSLATVVANLPYIKTIKFTLLPFRHISLDLMLNFLMAWQRLADHYHLKFVIEGIEDREFSEMLSKKGMTLHQGYCWGAGQEMIK